jgi:hypothetical protein
MTSNDTSCPAFYGLTNRKALALLIVSIFLIGSPLGGRSQSGRQKPPPSNANGNTRPRQTSKSTNKQPSSARSTPPQGTTQSNESEPEDVVRVSSNLVPVPAAVVDPRGVAIANLRLEDFELRVDGQPAAISDISRAETPVRLAMLFDNSGSLSESREFEKRAAIHFFRNVLRPGSDLFGLNQCRTRPGDD